MRWYDIIVGMTGKGDVEHGEIVHTQEIDRVIQLLSLEYTTLRDEMLTRISGRFQFLGLMTTAAALVGSGIGHSPLGLTTWATATLAAGVFLFGLASFWRLGRHILGLSKRIAIIERRLNELVPVSSGTPALMSWESERQHQSGRWYRNILNAFLSRPA